ncbi:MAG: PQQ-dependent sugar dehydrogenase [Deltaproteobacteria bacterium]|nr:PQQ-dependent sugar dehydrogenase [Deltaproteobacteria bacterium]
MPRRRLVLLSSLLAVALLLLWRREEVGFLWQVHVQAPSAPPRLPRLPTALREIASGFDQVTDLQAAPAPLPAHWLVVVEKQGTAWWLDRKTARRKVLIRAEVLTASEQGLLGLAFDPEFATNRLAWTNSVVRIGEGDFTAIDAWRLPESPTPGGLPDPPAVHFQRALSIAQPYVNHNAGQLAFGPDGMLYVGLGDGGSGGDPHDHGQNPASLLGKMLRIDVRPVARGGRYAVPADNPFVGKPGHAPEVWALGLRNPWRYSFDSLGRLIVADVGQDRREEISLACKGCNLGWRRKEGRACFEPAQGCELAGLREPFWQGRHPDHISVTGGYVYEGRAIPALAGKYVFGDFAVRHLWAVDVPPDHDPGREAAVYWLGGHDGLVTTFGRDRDGELLVGDFLGRIWQLVAAP